MLRSERLTSSCIEDLWSVLVWLRMRTQIHGRCALNRGPVTMLRTLMRRHYRHLVSSPSLPPRPRDRRPVPGTFRRYPGQVRCWQPRDSGSPSPARVRRLVCDDHPRQPFDLLAKSPTTSSVNSASRKGFAINRWCPAWSVSMRSTSAEISKHGMPMKSASTGCRASRRGSPWLCRRCS
jgi:hypothetical protein